MRKKKISFLVTYCLKTIKNLPHLWRNIKDAAREIDFSVDNLFVCY